jgi:protein O-GlcNAc transferase
MRQPGQRMSTLTLALSQFKAGRLHEAEATVRRFLALHPDHLDGIYLLGGIAGRLGRYDEAAGLLGKVATARPQFAEAHADLGDIFFAMGKLPEAEMSYRRALAFKPALAETRASFGRVLFNQGKIGEAILAYENAIRYKPDFAEAHYNLASLYLWAWRNEEAAAAYRRALAIDPEMWSALDGLIPLRMLQCDWDGLQDDTNGLFAAAAKGAAVVRPFLAITASSSPAFHLAATKSWAARQFAGIKPRFTHARPASPPARRIRLGYLSADLGGNAAAYVMAEVFERHDQERFETFAYSIAPNDGRRIEGRVPAAFEHFVDLSRESNPAAADRIFADRIDILVDLQGYTRGNRTEIVASRPAPIQVNWLGFPASMAVDFIDYIVVDKFVVPPSSQAFFTERTAYLPHCYYPSDTKREVAKTDPTRAECGLPVDGFVFCCFNNAYKLTPREFDVWMRILTAVPHSVLWLLGDETVKRNLAKEAVARGVDPARLVFAPRVLPPEHLARHRRADLFLDTFRVNAHTTAADALWMGVPLLTFPGEAFASRVAGSMLTTIGLPELIASSEEEYATLAVDLATNPSLLARHRERLAANRLTTPLFDMVAYTRAVDDILDGMWRRWCSG